MKNLKLIFSCVVICLVFVLCGAFIPNNASVKAEGEGISVDDPIIIETVEDLETMAGNVNNNRSYMVQGVTYYYKDSHYKLAESLTLTNEWTPIGTSLNPFEGTFDGNGKSIKGINIVYDNTTSSSLGLFGYIKNATIENVAVETTIILDDNGYQLPTVYIGAIAGRSENSTIKELRANLSLSATKVETVETYKYVGEIIAGGVVGESLTTELHDLSIEIKTNVFQVGGAVVNSYFGGVAGKTINGEIYAVYVAPTYSNDGLIASISRNNGNLETLSADVADIKISNSKTTSSKVVFGGITGYARGLSLKIYNSVFSTLASSSSPTKILYGGVVGEISENPATQPGAVESCKYLNASNSNMLNSSVAIYNLGASGYTLHNSVSGLASMPTKTLMTTASNWYEFRAWDFGDVWADNSVISYGGYFFPLLQSFSTYTINLSNNYVVRTYGGTYSSGYIYLNFEGVDQGITEKAFYAGDTVRIVATFYSEEDNALRDFKNYYNFTQWVKGDNTSIALPNGTNSGGYTSAGSSASTTLTFTASGQTEGTYGVGISGKSVLVNVLIRTEEETDQITIGSVNRTTATGVINNTSDFNFTVQYQTGLTDVLEALNSNNSKFLFEKWVDGNNLSKVVRSKTLNCELDNTKSSTTNRFYPTVVFENGQLKAKIICYYSSNTSNFDIVITGGGDISIDDGTSIGENGTQSLVKGEHTFTATAKENYKFEGWYSNGVLLSNNKTYTMAIDGDSNIEARFVAVVGGGGSGFPTWAIIVIVIGGLLLIGGIILIIIKVKRNSFGNYKKNFKY